MVPYLCWARWQTWTHFYHKLTVKLTVSLWFLLPTNVKDWDHSIFFELLVTNTYTSTNNKHLIVFITYIPCIILTNSVIRAVGYIGTNVCRRLRKSEAAQLEFVTLRKQSFRKPKNPNHKSTTPNNPTHYFWNGHFFKWQPLVQSSRRQNNRSFSGLRGFQYSDLHIITLSNWAEYEVIS